MFCMNMDGEGRIRAMTQKGLSLAYKKPIIGLGRAGEWAVSPALVEDDVQR